MAIFLAMVAVSILIDKGGHKIHQKWYLYAYFIVLLEHSSGIWFFQNEWGCERHSSGITWEPF